MRVDDRPGQAPARLCPHGADLAHVICPTCEDNLPGATRMTSAAVAMRCDHGVSLNVQCAECDSIMRMKPRPGVDISAILAERAKQHGKFQSHAEVTQDLKAVMWNFEIDGKQPFMELAADQRESLEMIQHKVGRILNGNANITDHWADIAGYAQLVADRLEGKIR